MRKIILLLLMFVSLTSCSQVVKLDPTEQGVYRIPIGVNQTYIVYFYLDTGAAESSITNDLLLALEEKGCVITKLEAKDYMMADGRIIRKERVLIKELQIGDWAIEDVPVTINNEPGAPMLLGQNVLRSFGSVEINYRLHTLTLTE